MDGREVDGREVDGQEVDAEGSLKAERRLMAGRELGIWTSLNLPSFPRL